MRCSRTSRTAFAVAASIGALSPTTVAASPDVSEDRAVGAAVAMSRLPSTPDGVIKGRPGDLVFGGARGQTISGFWTSADRRRATGFMIALPTVTCTGGLDAVDLRRVIEIGNTRIRQMRAGSAFTGGGVSGRGTFHASGTNFVSYSTPSGDVSGTIEESIAGKVSGDRVSGTYSATIWLNDDFGTPFALCSAEAVPWSGFQGAGRHFVGGTWRSPVYLERAEDGKRVKKIRIATNLTCEDGSVWQGYTGFRGIPVTHDRFPLASDTTDPWDVGDLHDVTTGGGTFHGTRVEGRFGDDVTVMNPVGEVTAHCVQTEAAWTALSSRR